MPNISWNKGNNTIKLGQLIEYNKSYVENKTGRLVLYFSLLFEKALKASGL